VHLATKSVISWNQDIVGHKRPMLIQSSHCFRQVDGRLIAAADGERQSEAKWEREMMRAASLTAKWCNTTPPEGRATRQEHAAIIPADQ
jgi:hypothetical protein